MSRQAVAVFGANGHTGRFVSAELSRRGIHVLPATRNGFWFAEGVEKECAKIAFDDGATLDSALVGADAIINCAGPFFDTALPAARAAIRAGIPYLDVAAEQTTVLAMFERLEDSARKSGVCIVPAMAFFGGLADLLACAVAGANERPKCIEIAVGLSSWHPTRGTRLTSEQNTFERMVVRGGKLASAPAHYTRTSWRFSGALGQQPVAGVQLSEIVLISRHIRVDSVTSYMNLRPLSDLQNQTTPLPSGDGVHRNSDQAFVIEAVATFADDRTAKATATGQDIYAATAPLVVSAFLELCANAPARGGVFAPGELFEARQFLASLEPAMKVRFEDSGSYGSTLPTLQPLPI